MQSVGTTAIPGMDVWLSGIDVGTQMLNQQFQEPFVAIVVRTNLMFLNELQVSVVRC